MSETVEFIVKMKDMMSGMWPKVAGTAHTAFGRVNNDINNTQNNLKKLTQPVKVRVDTSELGKANSMLGAIVGGNLIAAGIGKGAGMIKGLIADSIGAAMQYGMRAKSFEVMTGSAARGRELAMQLRELKQTSIMGASVYQNAQTLMGFGINDNVVIKHLKEIGNIAMGDTDRMASLTLAFAQTQAAGKLMGQDLLQYINAGFNPLSVMADKWKEFGFKQKVSVGQLKDLMSEGKISAAQIAKDFELATAKGGKFYGMMDQIAETAGGKLLKLKGNWAAMQIDLGNAMMPIASSFMDAGADMLHWMNISKTVPEQLMAEKMEVNTLVGSITKLNEGNAMRARLIDMLSAKYPDLFGNIDKEKIKNAELLDILNKVNGSYDQRMKYASYKMLAEGQSKEMHDLMELAMRAQSQAEAIRQGNKTQILSGWERYKITFSGLSQPMKYSNDADYLEAFATAVMKKLPGMQAQQMANENKVKDMDLVKMIQESTQLWIDTKRQGELWGKDKDKNRMLLGQEMDVWDKLRKQTGGKITQLIRDHDWSKLDMLLHPNKKGEDTNVSGAMGDSTSSVTGGGRRMIVINLNKSLIGEQIFNVKSMREGVDVSLLEQEEMLLRMIQGAANSV